MSREGVSSWYTCGLARLVMVLHECPESRFQAAVAEIAELEFLRAAPRAIRVIEEEFV